MKTPEITNIENQTQDNKLEKKWFPQDTKELFSKLNKSEWISEEFFISQIDRFKQDNKEWYKILDSMSNFFEQNNLNDTKSILAATLLIQQIQEKKWDKTEKFFKLRLKRKPAKIVKMIEWFTDDVDNLQKEQQIEKKEQQIEKKEQQVAKKEQEYIKKSNEVNEIFIHQITEKLKSDVNEKAPQYKEKITTLTQQIQQKYKVNQDEAYLAAFRYFYNNNQDFKNTIWKLDIQTKAVLSSVNIHISKLDAEKIISNSEVKSQVKNFAQNNQYKQQIENSVDTSVNAQDLSLDKFKFLVDKYKSSQNFQESLKKIGLKQETLEDYLSWKIKNEKVIHKIDLFKKELVSSFSNEFTTTYTKEYPNLAMTTYLKEIFTMFNETLGFENIQKDFNNSENLDISKEWKIDLSFKYKNVPLKFEVNTDWEIKMTDYLYQEQWIYKKWMSQLNQMFKFVWLKDILNPWKISLKDFLNKDWKEELKNKISKDINTKIQQNDSLWNKEIMKTETKFEVERQFDIYNMLKLYNPPYNLSLYENWQNEITKEKNEDLYKILTYTSNTINLKYWANEKLSQAFKSEDFRNFMKNLELDSGLSTYELFSKMHVLNNMNKTMSADKILKLSQAIQKKDVETLNKRMLIEWYEWKIENQKIKLEKENPDNDLDSRLSQVFSNQFLKTWIDV